MSEIKIKMFGSTTVATKESDGIWKVISSMYEKVSTDGETFKERKIEKMGMSRDYQEAFDTSISSLIREYNSLMLEEGSLFEELGEPNGVEANKNSKS